jgi:ABC-type sugar transport system ATPase subunit
VTPLRAHGLTKAFAGVRALSGVDFELRAGEVHALVGENGAGKSTLIKVLGGAIVPDAGTVRLDDQPLPLGDPRATRRAGVSIVYQEFTLVPDLTVADNIFLGREHGRLWLRRSEMEREAQRVLDELGVRAAASSRVRTLSIAQQQMVEIARALHGHARVLILDEPTATLSSVEVDRLFRVVRQLRGRGISTIYVSHRLDEIFSIADRVTVLRDGRHVLTQDAATLDRTGLIRAMVGREINQEFSSDVRPAVRTTAPAALEVRSLSARPRFSDVSLTVRTGEIVALAGLVGAGRTSAALALVGAIPACGEIYLNGEPVRFRTPADAIERGMAYVTEDRKGRGLFPQLGVDANITLTYLSTFARAGVLDTAGEMTRGRTWRTRAESARAVQATTAGARICATRSALAARTRAAIEHQKVRQMGSPDASMIASPCCVTIGYSTFHMRGVGISPKTCAGGTVCVGPKCTCSNRNNSALSSRTALRSASVRATAINRATSRAVMVSRMATRARGAAVANTVPASRNSWYSSHRTPYTKMKRRIAPPAAAIATVTAGGANVTDNPSSATPAVSA